VNRPHKERGVVTISLSGFFYFLSLLLVHSAAAQAVPYAREFQKPREEVDQALKDLQAYAGQKLPVVDGFVALGDKPLSQYERAFYQLSIDLMAGTPSGTIVRVSAKITAWCVDKDPAKSGYQVLPSNGRLELDLLDRLEEKFGGKPPSSVARALANSNITAPKPKLDLGGIAVGSPGSARPTAAGEREGGARGDDIGPLRAKREAEERRTQELNAELQTLQEIQRHQAHPLNLVVVKKSGTPVLAKPAESSGVLFTASADDEFEFIDAQGEWIHVQISGASRGYIRSSGVELPEFVLARLQSPNGTAPQGRTAAFRIEREENSTFPGDWETLKGKRVKIYTIQPVVQVPKESGASQKLDFAASLFRKYAAEYAALTPPTDGAVVIFDSADGGIVGATLMDVKQLADGSLSENDFWKQCYVDPPEAFGESRKP
jgi:hypothetical protein